ncbi:MAG: hybrid sensor histidine kinase/response regulator, partial [Methylococcales bacterium]|nr:hybrid sensor histidine kinase/response regulator [Methylococcales bacterium]
MKPDYFYSSLKRNWFIPIVLATFLIIVSFKNYLLFHTLVEFFAIIVAILVTLVIWQTHTYSRNNYLLYLGCGYIWIASLDFVHTIAYQGMNIFLLDGANVSVQLWISARFLEALVLLTAPFFLDKPFNKYRITTLFGFIAIVLCYLIFLEQFPTAYTEKLGLTNFKIISEYVIICLLLFGLIYLWIKRTSIDQCILTLMTLSIIFTVLAELS